MATCLVTCLAWPALQAGAIHLACAHLHDLEGGGEGLKDKMPAKRGHLEQPSEL
jgi:hypothetical protein